MNTRYTTVNLDVSQQGSIPSITLSQYDLGVGLSFYIMDGGMPYSAFAETDTVVLSGTKPSGVGFTIPAYYKSENLCSFRTTQAMTTEAGTVTCEITITKVNNISVSTANFFVEVEASAHAHEIVDEDIEDFSLIADQVGEYKATAVRAAQQAAQSATDAAASASSAEESMEAAQSAASSAIAAKDDIQEYIDDSEAWAKGTRGGEAVPSTDETYENNAKYYAEQSSQASMDAGVSATEAAASAQAAAASVVGAVKYTAQTLTTEQKAQARTNIGAASPSDIPSGTVRYDTAQSLTDAQKTQAKNNIGVPAIDATLAVTGAAADAKKVGDELTDIRGDFSDMNKVEIGGFVYGYYIAIRDPQVIDIANPVEDYRYKYAIVDCKPGDVFFISGYGGDSPRVYCFVSSNNTKLSYSNANENLSNRKVIAPANVAKVIIQDRVTDSSQDGKGLPSYKVMDVSGAVRFDIVQDKTEEEKAIARKNIGVNTDVDGLSYEAKQALLACFARVAWVDEHGQDYYDNLADALGVEPLPTFNYGVYTPETIVNGKYIDATGRIVDGMANMSFYYEDYIPVVRENYWIGFQPPGIKSDTSNVWSESNWRISEYDINKQFIKQTQYAGGQTNGSKSAAIITFNQNTKYIRLGFYDGYNSSSSPSHVFDIENPATITTLPMESGDIDASTGQNKTEVRRIRTKGYIPMTDSINVSGYPFGSQLAAVGVRCYDSSKNYLGYVQDFPSTDTTKTLLTNTAYIRMIMQYSGANFSEYAKCVGYLYEINGIRYFLV